MKRKRPFESCRRRPIPNRIRAAIMLRQEGRCADCGTRLILGFFVFDHRPPLALREAKEEPNDPERLAAICWTCDQQKTPRDLKEIARAKRLAEAHQEFLERQRDKVAGRRAPSRKQWEALEESVGQKLGHKPPGALENRPMPERATALDYARMYVEVMTWVRNAEDEDDRASLLETAEYFYKLSVTTDQDEPGIRARPLKELSFQDMHALADMFEGWAQDRKISAADQSRCFDLADEMRELAEVAGPTWTPPPRQDDDPVGLMAFLAWEMRARN